MCVAIEGWAAVVGKPKRTDDLKLPPEGLDDTIRSLVGKQVCGRVLGSSLCCCALCWRGSSSKRDRQGGGCLQRASCCCFLRSTSTGRQP